MAKALKKHINEFKNKNTKIDFNEFKELFDIDKLYLIVAKSILDYCIALHTHNPDVFTEALPPIAEIKDYVFYIINNLGKDYNTSIKIYDYETNSVVTYDFFALKKQLGDYLNRYKCNDFSLDADETEENNIRTNKKAYEYAQKRGYKFNSNKESDDTLFANWEFIRKGEGSKKDAISEMRENSDIQKEENSKSNNKKEEKSFEELMDELENRIRTLDSTEYIYKIVGVDKFDGYIGYLYKNGTILLEKLYSDEEKRIPCKDSGATYVMNIYNFIEFSKLSKQDIIKYISDTANPEVYRMYHTSTWGGRIKNKVDGLEYNVDTLALIEKMIEAGILKRKAK